MNKNYRNYNKQKKDYRYYNLNYKENNQVYNNN